ncbi:CAAX amino terminal protease self- immunity [Chlamydia serpentis]|uniref:CAAX amino terminal protease self- immunity n=1 Tax=Chlamydia serpentis TaxID=1967782 RepID=A0A2R8FAU2_9CHLA|nr:CPBP family intramembrane glutamic endopeptidase [Chlamydia serpentis]SPN73535.1 CAAX amino terminal protease self- immunity [Chlamydia serpentis]
MSKLILLFSLGLAALASRNFFVWPTPSGKTPLKLRQVIFGACLLIFSSLVAHSFSMQTAELLSTMTGISLAFTFLFYLLFLPLDITRAVLFSGERPLKSSWRTFGSAIRMWIIIIPITQLLGIMLSKFLTLMIPSEELYSQEVTQEVKNSLPMTKYLIGMILNLGVLTPFGEEIFFRGILQTFLKNKMTRIWAVVCSSIIFSLIHVEQSLGSWIFVPVLFVFSLSAGFLYEKDRHILSPIVLHGLFNLTSLMLLGIK